MPHERRFSQLHRVDWRWGLIPSPVLEVPMVVSTGPGDPGRVLAASGVKTHREAGEV